MKRIIMNLKEELSLDEIRNLGALKAAGYIICVLILMWVGLSFIDVISHNMGSCQYESWNLFYIMMKLAK